MNWVTSALSEAGITMYNQHYPLAACTVELTVGQHYRTRVALVVGRSILGKGVTAYKKICCDYIV